MTFAAIEWLNISINLLMVVFFVVCLLMVLLILMQRPKQEGLGAAFGTNVTDQVFGARTTNVLQRGTVYLASMFFILSLTLAILIGHRNKVNSLVVKNAPAPVAETPAAPPAPEKSISEEAKEAGQKVPETPPAPVTPAPPVETPPPAPTEVPPPAPIEPPAPPAEKPPGQ
jgi:preprotein translocase subunit SecG